ncbi:MAG TPA: fatty acid--CoA ligase family protein [Solirubrobacteraceae bacterium]|jgi:acyl-CoA synthetase (AMP-forming)/AMP-acid ligase II|nr:fatty acid--CoA ligase family protein [Solirubrobacteraceae bacterium]
MTGRTVIGAGPLRDRLLEKGGASVLLDVAGQARSGSELVERVDRLAGALAAEGLAGERVGVWYSNCVAAFEAFLAVEWIGATRVVLDPAAAPSEANSVLRAAGAKFALADACHAEALRIPVMLHADDAPCAGPPREPVIGIPAARPLHLYPRAVHAGELFGIPISYGNWAATIDLNSELYRSGRYGGGWDEGDEVFLALQQILHGTGLLGSFPFLSMGLPQVVMAEFDPEIVAGVVERFGVTTTGMTSGMLSHLVNVMEGHRSETRTLKRVIYGGAALPPEQMRRANELFGPVLVQIYGRLEGGWPLSILTQDDHLAILSGDERLGRSCGHVLGDPVEVRLRPVAGHAEPVGEICTRSGMAVEDYSDPDGWCALGDLARLDEEGYLYLEGRLDDMINTGYHVYPAEIEEAMLAIPQIRAVRVVGEPDPKRGELVAAYVVADASDSGVDAETLRETLGERLAPYKIPRRFHFVDTLPAVRSGRANGGKS